MDKAQIVFVKFANLFHRPPGGKSVAQLYVEFKNIANPALRAKAIKGLLKEHPELRQYTRMFTGKSGTNVIFRKNKRSIRF